MKPIHTVLIALAIAMSLCPGTKAADSGKQLAKERRTANAAAIKDRIKLTLTEISLGWVKFRGPNYNQDTSSRKWYEEQRKMTDTIYATERRMDAAQKHKERLAIAITMKNITQKRGDSIKQTLLFILPDVLIREIVLYELLLSNDTPLE